MNVNENVTTFYYSLQNKRIFSKPSLFIQTVLQLDELVFNYLVLKF